MSGENRAQRALRILKPPPAPRGALESTGGLESLESPGGLESIDTTGTAPAPDLSSARIKTSLEAARERFEKIAEGMKTNSDVVQAEQMRLLADAEEALKRLSDEGLDAQVTPSQLIGLEAIIIADGTRPALFVLNDDVDPGVAEAGSWGTRVTQLRDGIRVASRSVGRINAPVGGPNYVGTGWVVANGLIATNRHVLEALVGGPNPQADGTWKLPNPTTIDFAAEFELERKREFKVTGVRFASTDLINGVLNKANLDLALLEVEPHNGVEDLPPPLALSRRIKAVQKDAEIYVMGYPARPLDELGKVLLVVFQDEYFVKRFAPGLVEEGPDGVEDGGHKRVFTHDASTLGGNSGSCVIELFLEGKAVVGLHFGGLQRDENYAHSIARIEEVLAQHGAQFQDT